MATDDVTTSDPNFTPWTCEACRVIDRADGSEDGGLFAATISGIRNEHWLWHALRRAEDRTADQITGFAGSMRFIYIHGAWFAAWILVNVGLTGAGWEFDKFPFGLLTMIVSLEAIFLATFVMISQNRQAQRSDLRSEIDFETNLRAAIWTVHVGEALGINANHVEGVVQEAVRAARQHLEGLPNAQISMVVPTSKT
jgi:uncharacterized membrane protein